VVLAAPLGGSVISGTASIGQSNGNTTINQSTPKATINWQGFSIGTGETVTFKQPNASAITLNRVIGNERSVIDGALNANGRVFLVNSNGVLFGKGSQVNTAGLIASTLNISDDDFKADNYVFKGSPSSGSVISLGSINVADGGYVALLGRQVDNQGSIKAKKGVVALSSGEKISLNFSGNSLINVSIDQGTLDALVRNGNAIYADGGKVILSAKAAGDLLNSQVNNTGIVQARTLADLTSEIAIDAGRGTANLGGTLDASASGTDLGGKISAAGAKVQIADDAVISTKSAAGTTGLFSTVADSLTVGSGGDLGANKLGQLLANNNVSLTSAGDLNIKGDVTWASDTGLLLNAGNDLNIGAKIKATGDRAGLTLSYGKGSDYHINTAQGASVTLSGNAASLNIGGNAYQLIHGLDELAALDDNLGHSAAGYYALAGDLNAPVTPYGGAVLDNLSGTLAGMGHTVNKLSISAPSASDPVGLIGLMAAGSKVRDIGIVGANISGNGAVGGLAGRSDGGTISNAYATGKVSGTGSNVGGLVGLAFGVANSISDSYANVAVSGQSYLGGLAGRNDGMTLRSYALGDVTALGISPSQIGGLLGYNRGTVSDSYAKGNVYATQSPTTSSIGGLVGGNSFNTSTGSGGIIVNSYATGNVITKNASQVGGLVGKSEGGYIGHVWASGDVSMSITGQRWNGDIGGLIGLVGGTIVVDAHAKGNVTVDSGTGYYIQNVGGAFGNVTAGTFSGWSQISDVSASGNVTAKGTVTNVGGGAGQVFGGPAGGASITNMVVSGDVTGGLYVGGGVGVNYGKLDHITATGNVNGNGMAGALVGRNYASGTVSYGYATGSVKGGSGLFGENLGKVSNSSYRDLAAERKAAADTAAAKAKADAEAAEAKALADAAKAKAEAEAEAAATLQARADAGTRLASANLADTQRLREQLARAPQPADGSVSGPAPVSTNLVFAKQRSFSSYVQQVELDGEVFKLEDNKKTP